MPYYRPTPARGLPTLAPERTFDTPQYPYMRRWPAPYGYPEAQEQAAAIEPHTQQFRPTQRTTTQTAATTAATTTPTQTTAATTQTPVQNPPSQIYDAFGYPLLKERGSGWARYYDPSGGAGSYVDYNSLNWKKVPQLRGGLTAEQQVEFDKMPDSWKADLAGRDPAFVQAYMQAVLLGNTAQARDIYAASEDYRRAQQQGQKPPPPQIEYRNAAYYVPTQ